MTDLRRAQAIDIVHSLTRQLAARQPLLREYGPLPKVVAAVAEGNWAVALWEATKLGRYFERRVTGDALDRAFAEHRRDLARILMLPPAQQDHALLAAVEWHVQMQNMRALHRRIPSLIRSLMIVAYR
jgi:hypothetical protein